jgi:DNA-binding IclR family transcriptional regulator
VELASPKPLTQRANGHASPASQTLGRGLDVLEEVAAGPVALNVIAARLGLSRSTVHRLAASLLERRYLTLAPRRGYSLGPKLLELGSRARGQISLVRAARPFMEMLAETTGDAVLLAVRDGDDAVLADNVPGSRRVSPRLRIGERMDLLHSAAGRALLLEDDQAAWQALWDRLAGGSSAEFLGGQRRAAQAGIVLDPGLADAEIVSAAAPIRGADGCVRGALGLALAAAYREPGLSPAAQDALRRAADAVSEELGWRNPTLHDAEPAVQALASQTERELLGMGGPAGSGTVPVNGTAASRPRPVTRGTGSPGKVARLDTIDGDEQGMKGRGA